MMRSSSTRLLKSDRWGVEGDSPPAAAAAQRLTQASGCFAGLLVVKIAEESVFFLQNKL